ncbi:MAG: hypothetical protein HC826_02675 [Rhodospirillales bacterium]|nr:hypothetical protein [Rhodospirillales bacterium]
MKGPVRGNRKARAQRDHHELFRLLEVGLGGRLDATNVIERPALCVITPVSMDHAEKLGATLPLIAREKAGILKRGVTAVIAEQDPSGEAVIAEAAGFVGAPLLMWGQDFQSYEQNGRLVVQVRDEVLDLPLPGLIGRHQIGNERDGGGSCAGIWWHQRGSDCARPRRCALARAVPALGPRATTRSPVSGLRVVAGWRTQSSWWRSTRQNAGRH